MPKYFHPDVQDDGLNEVVSNANELHLVKNYAQGDAYAVVLANSIASAATVPGDYPLSDQGTLGRQLTSPAKSPTSTGSSIVSDDLHIALLDTAASRVLMVTDETSDQPITAGNVVNIPAVNFKKNQPV